jgi:hypothetical protein
MKKMIDTSSVEYLMSFLGAILLSFGLGVMFSNYFLPFAIIITALGLVFHSIGMYKMYSRRD